MKSYVNVKVTAVTMIAGLIGGAGILPANATHADVCFIVAGTAILAGIGLWAIDLGPPVASLAKAVLSDRRQHSCLVSGLVVLN
jgi:hypothetical protein